PLELRGLLRRGYADGYPAERSPRPGDRRGDARRADALGDPGHVGARRPLRAAPAHGGLPDDDHLRAPRGPPDRAEPDCRPARRLQAGEIVFTDMGARFKGYCGDTARGKVVGDAPTAEQRRFLDAQIAIVHETIAMVKPGVRIGDLATRAAEMAKELGYEEWF